MATGLRLWPWVFRASLISSMEKFCLRIAMTWSRTASRFGARWGPVRGWMKKGRCGVFAELVAEHSETPGRIAEALGDLMRGEALDKIGS
jgi:hypothetical protein